MLQFDNIKIITKLPRLFKAPPDPIIYGIDTFLMVMIHYEKLHLLNTMKETSYREAYREPVVLQTGSGMGTLAILSNCAER